MESLQVIESSFVAPMEATPAKVLWLSPIDLAATRGHTTVVRFYPSGAEVFDVARLKEAMAKALVAFYPLAGRVGVDSKGRLEISCNGEGVLFVVARSCLVAQDLDFSKPSLELRRICVPRIEPPSLVMALQVTFFKCGGVALGTAMHHAVTDGSSTSHFLQTWSAIFRDGDRAAIELPCHDRTLLRARSPPAVHPDALSVLYPKVALAQSSSRPNATEAFPISRDQLVTLKRLCGGASTFCAVSAVVWKCAAVARRLPPDAIARLSFPVNLRRRGALTPPLPARYFGNALVSLCVAGAAREIASEALASVAARINGAIARMGDELVRSAIDYLELADKDSIRPPKGSLPETELRIVSWLSFPRHVSDFGCGPPRVMRAESSRGGFVHLIRDDGNAIRVVVCMEAANMKEFGRLLYANIPNQASKL